LAAVLLLAARPAKLDESRVDASTLRGKFLLGYQGWFGCPGDGSPVDRWFHWSRNNRAPDRETVSIDFWPDTVELDADELCATGLNFPDGSNAGVYSAWRSKTVARHFRWMRENAIDGVMLQRFTSELRDSRFFQFRNQVARNVRAAAEDEGRVFAIMYDISGQNASTLVADLENDWRYLVDTLHVTESPAYLRHHGDAVVAIWGFGFTDRPGTAADATAVIDFFRKNPEPSYRAVLMGGVPTYWRTLTRDSKTDASWSAVYRSFDVVSPWSVGRFSDADGADRFARDLVVPDLEETRAAGIEYMPVVFPGFSRHNLSGGALNQIPRRGGAFLWRQVYNAVSAGARMLYGAMFDEVDEGTALFKVVARARDLPVGSELLALDADGVELPSDWYLRLVGRATRMLRGEMRLVPDMPKLRDVR